MREKSRSLNGRRKSIDNNDIVKITIKQTRRTSKNRLPTLINLG